MDTSQYRLRSNNNNLYGSKGAQAENRLNTACAVTITIITMFLMMADAINVSIPLAQ